MKSSKPFYYSKTLWLNFLVILTALLTYVIQPDFPVQLPQASIELVASVLAVLNIALRFTSDKKLTS